jgi:hypothetical protein
VLLQHMLATCQNARLLSRSGTLLHEQQQQQVAQGHTICSITSTNILLDIQYLPPPTHASITRGAVVEGE